jgi:hypothetical protein
MEGTNVNWRKASYSDAGGANCVEVGNVPWRKASYSANGGENCVEVASAPRLVAVRDTKQAGRVGRTVMTFTPEAWQAFTATLR